MANGRGLIIGINHVNPEGYYQGWDGKLNFCEKDALAVAGIAASKGFENTILLTADATADAIKNAIEEAANELVPGDIFLIYYSGHGNTYRDKSGDEEDGSDEMLCVFDRQLLDDELYVLWPKFKDGVRVLFLTDACHSGGMLRGANDFENDPDYTAKAMDERAAKAVVRADRNVYKKIRETLPPRDDIPATVRLIAGCHEYQRSYESKKLQHGQFTSAILDVWQDGSFGGNYGQFFEEIDKRMPEIQNPKFVELGAPNDDFETQAPFTV